MTKMLPLYWYISSNFGDTLAPWLVRKLKRVSAGYVPIESEQKKAILGGSLLSLANVTTKVWGTGIGSADEKLDPTADYRGVRGPISYARLLASGWSKTLPLGDSALILPDVLKDLPYPDPDRTVGIVPHFVDFADVVRAYGRFDSLRIINILDPIEEVVTQIRNCSRILSSSLHGLIVAGAFGVPARWVKFSNRLAGDGVKFADYQLSVGLQVMPVVDLSGWPPIYGLDSQACFTPTRWDIRPLKESLLELLSGLEVAESLPT